MMTNFFEFSLLQLLTLFIIIVQCYGTNDPCTEQEKCICKLKNDRIIDLTQIKPNKTFFKAYYHTNNAELIYYFHPCSDELLHVDYPNITITTNDCNQPSSLCRLSQKPNNSSVVAEVTNLGTAEDSKFSDDLPKSLIFTDKKKGSITATILLECIEDPEADTILAPDEKSVSPPRLILFSPHACIKQLHHGWSVGTTLLFLFLLFFAIYFIGGALVLHFLRGAQGKEMIPNVDFWSSLPGLMKDGFIFVLNGCKPTTISTAETYDRI